MNDETLDSPVAIKTFLAGTSNIKLSVPKKQRYEWIASTLKRTNYLNLSKPDKSAIREYLGHCTDYSQAQLTRLITQYKQHKWIGRKKTTKNSFPRRYTNADILRLHENDEAHQQPSGTAVKKLLERAYFVFKNEDYKNLANISVSHIYNLRNSDFYQRQGRHFTKTQATQVNIGQRRQPIPNGDPGYIRIDTVHQGDKNKQKGVYHINAVDEVTQMQVVATVEKISEKYLIPVLEELLKTFPFKIINFHSDNGSEYINHRVANLLNKLHIEMTKSRSRHSNDNALAESKNASTVRKHFGFVHIPQKWAKLINEFNKKHFNPYLNFHRPCHFPVIKVNKKGKEIKKYPYDAMMTPYEKLKSLPNANGYLKEGFTFEDIDKRAYAITDLQSAKEFQKEKWKLFKTIFGEI